MSRPITLRDFENLARERIEPGAFAYYSGGAMDEVTLRANEAAFARRILRPRVLVDVSDIDTSTTLLGTPVAQPFGIAPTATHAFAHPDGECATAAAASDAGVLFCASSSSSRPLEDIAAACAGPRWFQLYTQDNDGPRTQALIERAQSAGYTAIVLTVDLPVSGRRERELRVGYQLAVDSWGNFRGEPKTTDPPPPRFTWRDLAWLRRVTSLPLVLKGILTGEDARLCVEHGVDAVWVSNHGGRQLDRSPATIDVLEEVVDAAGGLAEVYLDGGVRRGTDVVTALALGARSVFIGRPVLYALAYDGAAGVRMAVDMLTSEVRHVMALLGTPAVADIGRTHVEAAALR